MSRIKDYNEFSEEERKILNELKSIKNDLEDICDDVIMDGIELNDRHKELLSKIRAELNKMRD